MTGTLDDARQQRQTNSTARIPPHDLAAERGLLGAMLLSADTAVELAEQVTPEAFYRPGHGHIYHAVMTLIGSGEPVDATTVADQLRRSGLLETAGGPAALIEMITEAPTRATAARYASIVADHQQLRQLIGAAGEIAETAYNLPGDVGQAVDQAETMVYRVAENRRGGPRARPIADTLTGWLTRLENLYDGGDILGAPTGWLDLDAKLLGLRPGQLVIIAARPAMGKSALAGNTATHIAGEINQPVLFISVEMVLDELQDRFVAAESRVDLQRIRSGRLLEQDWPRISQAIGRFADMPLWLHDAATATLNTIRAETRRVTQTTGRTPIVIVDYLQLLTTAEKTENRQIEVAELARGCKRIAMEHATTVIALSQLNRDLERRSDKRPALADLRESGEIEQAADIVIGLYRDDYYDEASKDKGIAELLILKHRNGPTGTVKLAWLDHYGRFANMARV